MSLTYSASGDAQDLGLSSCSRSSWSGELLFELMRGCPSFWVPHFPSPLLWLMAEDGGPGFGGTADTEAGISEEPAAPKNGYGENGGNKRGQIGGSCRKMFIKVSKQAEGRAGKDCKPLGKGGSGRLCNAVSEAACSLPREVMVGRGRAWTRQGAWLGTTTAAWSNGPEA